MLSVAKQRLVRVENKSRSFACAQDDTAGGSFTPCQVYLSWGHGSLNTRHHEIPAGVPGSRPQPGQNGEG